MLSRAKPFRSGLPVRSVPIIGIDLQIHNKTIKTSDRH